ncbi:MAG TPA: hypothetical protein VNA88_16205 [Candidatus Kapabacteria bacterium]|jgi:hypothetical protein|nr:hypothetical protein [Candidatus Kapabacteria bacterium]
MKSPEMKGPEERPRQEHQAAEADVERPVDDQTVRESQETTDANLAMNEEFIDAGNESHLEEDAAIDDQRGDGGAVDDVERAINNGVTARSAG